MPENPLLPNAQLRALHALLTQTLLHEKAQRGRGHARRRSTQPPLRYREALLAGTLLQLSAGDILVADRNDSLPNALLRSRESAVSLLELSSGSPQLTLAAALASGLQQTGDRVVFVLLRAGADVPQWTKTLALAEQSKLPLILACADPSGDDAFRLEKTSTPAKPEKFTPITWSAIQKTAAKHKLPVLSVDGEDAVAVFRVMQESILRARSGGGPAILWAMLPADTDRKLRPHAALPLRRLQRYLKARNIEI